MDGTCAPIETTTEVARLLASQRYAIVPGRVYRLSPPARAALGRLQASYGDLPPDQYLPDGGSYRYRRYGSFLVWPAAGRTEPLPAGPYRQSARINAFAGGIDRHFPPLAPAMLGNEFLAALLLFNVGLLPSSADCWYVDLHVVRVTAVPDEPGQPSPEGVHRDGFDFISIHLMQTQGASGGGVTRIVRPSGETVLTHRLAQPLDSVYLDDAALLHDVTPLTAAGQRAHRDVLLLSYRSR